MKPGRELDAEIAEKVMGWQRYGAICYKEPKVLLVAKHRDCWNQSRTQSDPGSWTESTDPLTYFDNLPRYSTEISAAWLVVEHLREKRLGELPIKEVLSLAHCYTAKQVAGALCNAALSAHHVRDTEEGQ